MTIVWRTAALEPDEPPAPRFKELDSLPKEICKEGRCVRVAGLVAQRSLYPLIEVRLVHGGIFENDLVGAGEVTLVLLNYCVPLLDRGRRDFVRPGFWGALTAGRDGSVMVPTDSTTAWLRCLAAWRTRTARGRSRAAWPRDGVAQR
jgi:hypothetical protein